MVVIRTIKCSLVRSLNPKNLKAAGAASAAVGFRFSSLVRLLLLAAIVLGLLGPSYAQDPLPVLADSWTGMHSYVVFSPHGTFTSEFIKSIAPRYDFGWSVGGTFWTDFEIGNPSFINSLYVDATQGFNTLAWYQQNHPDWILYNCDRTTPLQAYDYLAVIPDFSNPAFVEWKWQNAILPLTINPQEGIGFDNALLSNDFVPTPGHGYGHACGVYDTPGHWVQKFAGVGSFAEVFDPQFTDAFIAFLANIRDRLHALSTPKLLIVNTNPIIVSNDAARRAAFIAAVDGVLVEGAAYGPEWVGDSRKLWLNNIKLSQEMDAAGKGVYGEMRGVGTGEASIDPVWIQFNLASYLLGKGHHNALRIRAVTELPTDTGIYWPTEFEAANQIGSPCALMTQVAGVNGTENGMYMREYTGGLSVVNASLTTAYSAPLPSGSYKDLYNNTIIGSSVNLQPSQGRVLLKTSGTSCSSGLPVISALTVSNITPFAATISWTTDKSTDTQVEFTPPCPASGCLTTLIPTLTSFHTVDISGLTPSTTYTYRVRSRDAQNNLAVSSFQNFTTLTIDVTPPVISSILVTGITSTSAKVKWTTNEPADGLVEIVSPCALAPCQTPLVSTLTTSHIISVSGLTPGTLYTYRIRSKDAMNNLATSPDQTFSTMPAGFATYSLWNNATVPGTPSAADNRAIEVGVKFKADVNGTISGIRFYKGPQNTGTHTVSLYTSAGVLLVRSVSTNESVGGWQQVDFDVPVNITANATYVASYHTTSGYYSFNSNFFGSQLNVGPLHALQDGVSGPNGAWQTGAAPVFPTQGFQSGNFWVDVVFGAVIGGGDSTPPAVSSISVSNITSSGGTVNWITDEPADGQVEIITPCASVPCLSPLVSTLSTSHAIALTSLGANTQYTYRILTKDSTGNQTITPNQTFTTAVASGGGGTTYSLWPNGPTPGTPNSGDTRAISVGVKFKADQDGTISGIRFYKGSQNTGTHTVGLWSAASVLLAQSVSVGETASGWQQVNFAPVNILANTTYIASYYTTSGNYSFDSFYFNNQYNNGLLHALADGPSGGNGVWQTNGSPIFPNQNFQAANFWVDVVYTPSSSGGDVTPPVISGISPTNITSTGATVNWTTNEPADGQVEFISPCPAGGCTLPIVSALSTTHAVAVTGLNANTVYTYVVRSRDASNNLATSTNQVFTTLSNGANASLWSNSVNPTTQNAQDGRAIEVGVKFRSDVDGMITGIRFFKGSQNVGTHTATLWASDGTNLARKVSVGETASGWQQVNFATPVAINANTTYVASYHTTTGYYSFDGNYFTNQFNNPPLRALADATSGGNGVFAVNATPTFPNQNFLAGNFWVDVVFSTGGSDTTAPVISGISVTSITTSGGTVNWTTDEPATGQVEIVSPCAVAPCLSSLVSALSTSHAITLSGLNANTLYTYRMISKDASNNTATSANQTFTTLAVSDTTAPVISGISVTGITTPVEP